MARPRQVTDAEILSTARDCFLQYGASVSVETIAERLGISQPALFRRFGTKQQLLVQALAPPEVPPWIELLADGPDQRPFCDQLIELAEHIALFFDRMVPAMSVLRCSGIEPETLLQRYAVPPPLRAKHAVTEWLQRARDAGLIRRCAPEVAARALLGALQARSFYAHVLDQHPDDNPQGDAQAVVNLLWDGLAPAETECHAERDA